MNMRPFLCHLIIILWLAHVTLWLADIYAAFPGLRTNHVDAPISIPINHPDKRRYSIAYMNTEIPAC